MKNEKIKANPLKKSEYPHTVKFCKDKISTFQQMITNTIIAVQKYKVMDIVGASDMNTCIQNLEVLYKDLHNPAACTRDGTLKNTAPASALICIAVIFHAQSPGRGPVRRRTSHCPRRRRESRGRCRFSRCRLL